MISRSARLGVAVALLAVLGTLVGHRLWLALTDPASAECSNPPIALGQQRAAPTHRELDVVFTCEDVRLAGTIYLPAGWGPSPGVVWVHGAGEAARLGWGGQVVPGLVAAGFAVLSYDKRGVGQSEGACCPGDQGHFNLLTADVEGAIGVWSADDKPLSCQSYRPDWAHPRETSSVKPRRPGVLLGVTVGPGTALDARLHRCQTVEALTGIS
jgi:hypothetical protein